MDFDSHFKDIIFMDQLEMRTLYFLLFYLFTSFLWLP